MPWRPTHARALQAQALYNRHEPLLPPPKRRRTGTRTPGLQTGRSSRQPPAARWALGGGAGAGTAPRPARCCRATLWKGCRSAGASLCRTSIVKLINTVVETAQPLDQHVAASHNASCVRHPPPMYCRRPLARSPAASCDALQPAPVWESKQKARRLAPLPPPCCWQ